MKYFKNIIRAWIGLTSIFGFFGAWAMLAQSYKPSPTQPLSVIAYPTLTELAPIGSNFTSQPDANLQVVIPATPTPYPTQPPQIFFARPRLRTSGS